MPLFFLQIWGFAAPGEIELTAKQLLGIAAALLGAALMSFGTQYQSRGLNKVEQITQESAAAKLTIQHLLSLLRRPSWLSGSAMLGTAVLLQIVALSLAPLIVVQPLGVVALVITSILNAKISGIRLTGKILGAVVLCVVGVMSFVSVAAFTAKDVPVVNSSLSVILVIFGVCAVFLSATVWILRNRPNPLVYIVGAGVLYAFVATLAKAVISRVQQQDFDFLSWIALACLIAGAVLGMIYVQNAHSSGPPDLVIAGLTVIDPIVAVVIGIVVLGEATGAPLWARIAFVLSGLLAMVGVFIIAKFHPQVGKNSLVEGVLR